MKRNPILLNKMIKDVKEEKKYNQEIESNRSQIIAVVGAYEGAGCTHHALNLAYTLSKNYKTALVELDNKSELVGFNDEYELKEGTLDSKRLEDLEVYFDIEGNNISNLAKIIKQKYEYIILDMGCIYEDNSKEIKRPEKYNEICRADKRILITQLKEWKNKYFERVINNEDLEDWIIGINLSNIEDFTNLKKEIKKTYKKAIVINLEYCEVFKCDSKLHEVLGGNYEN